MKHIEFDNVEQLREALRKTQTDIISEVEKQQSHDDKKTIDGIIDGKDGQPTKSENDVVYAKEGYNNIFKHIIFFTNDKNPDNNKTLKNLYEAQKNIKQHGEGVVPKLHIFIADEVSVDELDNERLRIYDSDDEFVIDEESNADTLVFNRLGAIGEDNCEHVVTLLQDRGFLVLNPIKGSKLACDKYDSACLFTKGDIPQPRYALMTRDIFYDKKMFKKAMNDVCDDWDDEMDCEFVVKILDGHGGTGVALIPNKLLNAIFQMLFAIDSDRKFLIQHKEEADGGDIRVHVLTLRNKQVILAAMKRVKISKDFRSNVSLGATAEPVKLTPEQEQIALKTARLSTLPWCAVDIMPLVKDSNKEIGDNVVLEINASPGTDGISDVLDYNFINVLLNELDSPHEFMLQTKVSGFIESATIDFGKNPTNVLAKLDTGNGAQASHIEVGEYKREGDRVSFEFNGKKYEFDVIGTSVAIVGDKKYERPIICVPSLKLGKRVLTDVHMAIVQKRDKSTNMLINRDVLSKFGYAVSSADKHLLSAEMEKIKIL